MRGSVGKEGKAGVRVEPQRITRKDKGLNSPPKAGESYRLGDRGVGAWYSQALTENVMGKWGSERIADTGKAPRFPPTWKQRTRSLPGIRGRIRARATQTPSVDKTKPLGKQLKNTGSLVSTLYAFQSSACAVRFGNQWSRRPFKD